MATDFLEYLRQSESALIAKLNALKAGIDNATGKGTATEQLICAELIRPQLPPGFVAGKGAVVASDDPDARSPTIDRVVYDAGAAPPLLFTADHSIFPLEAVAALVEITMRLDAGKLRQDIERMAPIKVMRDRHFVSPVRNSTTLVWPHKFNELSVRSFIVGLPASTSWSARDIAYELRVIQKEIGPPTHVHALYVLGIGCFVTVPVEIGTEEIYRIQIWEGPQALFRFTTALRTSLDRWPRSGWGTSVHLDRYLPGRAAVLSDSGYHDGI